MNNHLARFTERKVAIENHDLTLSNKINTLQQNIKDAQPSDPHLHEWNATAQQLKIERAELIEAKMKSLCDDIQKVTQREDTFKRASDATNKNLNGREWVQFVMNLI